MTEKRQTLDRNVAQTVEKGMNHRQPITPNSSKTQNIYPNLNFYLDIDQIATTENGTFVDNIKVTCPFCPNKFDRPDESRLHYAEKHSKTYGILPDMAINSNEEINFTNTSAENDAKSGLINNSALITKRRLSRAPSISYNEEEIDTSSSGSDTSEDNGGDEKSSGNTHIHFQEPGNSINNLQQVNNSQSEETRIERKRLLIKTKDSLSFSNDSSLEGELRNIVEKFVKKLSKTFMKHLKGKTLQDNSEQNNILYKCSKCFLHFHKKDKLFNHFKRGKHNMYKQQPQCDYCKLHFTRRAMEKHVKRHMSNEHLCNNKNITILTENDCNFHNISDNSTSEHPVVGNVQFHVPISEVESSNNTAENIPNFEIKSVVDHTATKAQQTKLKKGKKNLYKCDDCELHFLRRTNLESHLKDSTHLEIKKNTTCDQCTYKFSSANTLARHKLLHHNREQNLSKDDFKILTITQFGPNKPNSLTRNRNISPKAQPKIFKNKQYLGKELHKRTLLFRCEGCNQCSTSQTTFLRHLRTCEGKILSRKYVCQKCKLYFITKFTLHRHENIHKIRPLLKPEFTIISRKPINYRNANVPQSNIVSTTEANDDESIMEEDHKNSSEISERDKCKVKLSKISKSGWSVVSSEAIYGKRSSNIDKQDNTVVCNDRSIINKITLPSTSADKHVNKIVKKRRAYSINDLNREANLINTDSITNVDSTSKQDLLDLSETSVRKSFEQNVMTVVNSHYFEKDHADRTATTTKTDEDHSKIENEILKEEIESNGMKIPETRYDIQIANTFTIKVKFEESDTLAGCQESSPAKQKYDLDDRFPENEDSQDTLILEPIDELDKHPVPSNENHLDHQEVEKKKRIEKEIREVLILSTTTNNSTELQTSNDNLDNPSFSIRDRTKSYHERGEESQNLKNGLDSLKISNIENKPVSERQNKNIQQEHKNKVENQEVFEISDDDGEDIVDLTL